jgi:hypothetical protein
MRFVFLLLVAAACGLAYVYYQQPVLWNQWVKQFNLPPSLAIATPSAGTPTATSDNTPANPPAPDASQAQPIMISPYATNYINPDHVHPVEQPTQPNPTTNNPSQ